MRQTANVHHRPLPGQPSGPSQAPLDVVGAMKVQPQTTLLAVVWRLQSRPMKLTDKQRRYLRGLAHPLKPVILIGNAGVSEGVVAETRRALQDHELIKVRMTGAEREARDTALENLARDTGSALVGRIGHVATLYKKRSDLPKIVLPD